MRRFYASTEQFNGTDVLLSPEETRHLRNVLRLKIGDEAHVFDGDGHEFLCRISDIRKAGAVLEVLRGVSPAAPESTIDLTLAAAVYKNDKLDLVVQKAVELGVATFVPLVTFRSEAKLRDAEKRVDRWRKIAMEATKQCERARVMRIADPMQFDEFVARDDGDLRLMFSEKDGGGIPQNYTTQRITALIGPKGGWEDSEIELATGSGFLRIKLGKRIMRAETAAITFAALVQHRFGDLN